MGHFSNIQGNSLNKNTTNKAIKIKPIISIDYSEKENSWTIGFIVIQIEREW